MRALGKASYINGSHFAILWVNARGETEHYASEVFQSKLGVWFNPEVVAQARKLVAAAGELQTTPGSGLSQATQSIPEEEEDVAEQEDDDGLDQDDPVSNSIIAWDQAAHDVSSGKQSMQGSSSEAPVNGTPHYPLADLIDPTRQRIHAPELRRTSSMPNPQQAQTSSLGNPTSLKVFQAPNRLLAIDMKAIHDDQKFQMPTGPPNSSNPEYKALTIGNHDEVTAFLATRFRQLQQHVCKIVAKAWIKVIEPKKQSRYPYNKGEHSKPTWWPDDVRHKEPDHLMKPERIALLMTMLRCGKIPANRLELATAEVAAFIPPDKINLLREIYRVGREEERYKCDEIPGDTRVYVAATATVSAAGLEIDSPSTCGLATREDITPKTSSMGDTHVALQRSTSHQTSQFEGPEDPFADTTDIQQGYPMMPTQNFYYGNGDVSSYAASSNAAVMHATNQALSAQQFQQAQQQQMFAAQQAHTRRQSRQPLGHVQDAFGVPVWPQTLDHAWPTSPSIGVFQQPSIDHPLGQAQPHHPSGQQTTYYNQVQSLGTPARQTSHNNPEQRSSPFLPTPIRPDPNFSAPRAPAAVSFSDYLHSPRTGGPGPTQDDDNMHDSYE